jgi:hypothetical protein
MTAARRPPRKELMEAEQWRCNYGDRAWHRNTAFTEWQLSLSAHGNGMLPALLRLFRAAMFVQSHVSDMSREDNHSPVATCASER